MDFSPFEAGESQAEEKWLLASLLAAGQGISWMDILPRAAVATVPHLPKLLAT